MERLPGFRDFYPEPLPHADTGSADARQYIFEKWRAIAKRYNFREYDGPRLNRLNFLRRKAATKLSGNSTILRTKANAKFPCDQK